MKKTQKILSAALSAALVLSAMAVPTFADEAETAPATTETGGTTIVKGEGEGGAEGGSSEEIPVAETKAAQIGDEKYDTVKDAVDAVKGIDGKTAEIKLLNDVTESINIPSGVTVTLDLNDKNINVNTESAIINKGTLTVKGNGNVSASGAQHAAVANFPDASATLNGGTYISANWYVIKNLGTMVIDGKVSVKKPDGSTDTSSLVDNGWYGNAANDTIGGSDLSANAQADKASLTIKSGDFIGKSGSKSCSVIKNDDYGTLNIMGGTFDSTYNTDAGNAATILNWNVATISGGTFNGQYPISNGAYNNEADKGQITITGGKFTGSSSIFGKGEDGNGMGTVTISGGTFSAPTYGNAGLIASKGGYTVSISGGTFTKNAFNPDYCASGYTYVTDGEGNTIVAAQRRKPSGGSTGGGGSSTVTSSYSVTFNTNGGSTIAKETVEANSVLEKPTAPTKEGYDFAGWYTDKELTTVYDFTAKITKNLTLYAAWAEKGDEANQIILTIGEKTAKAFGETKTNDVAPKIVNDRTMLPARFVAESLGAKVDWDEEKQLVTIVGVNEKNEEVTILITIDSDIALVNGKEVKLDSPAFIENDRTYTPLRFISENLGAKVDWNEEQQKVTITKLQATETAETDESAEEK